MDIQIRVDGDSTILEVSGRLDAVSATTAESSIDQALEDGACHLVLNLAGLEYISSAGLRVLLATAKKLSKRNGSIVLCELRQNVREVFEISGLLSIFPIAENEAEAQSLAKGCGT